MKFTILFAFLLLSLCTSAQDTLSGGQIMLADSLLPIDSLTVKVIKPDTISLQQILDSNRFINTKAKPVLLLQKEKQHTSREFMFYLITGVFFFFGILKLIYDRYISIVFRVFFNTSLRQSQLTDQLLQAKLPSLLFNIYFCIIGGLYVYLLLDFYGFISSHDNIKYLWMMMALIALIYTGKYLVLKFTGWVSGYKQEAGTYIFIVFLINKILAIFLMPVVLIIAFAENEIAYATVIFSYFVMILLFLLRYLRSYSLLQNKLSIKRFHFFLYITGVELVPLLLLYKIADRLLVNYM